MSIINQLNDVKETVIATVSDTKVSQDVVKVIDEQKAKLSTVCDELKRRGRESEIGRYVMKAYEYIKALLSKLIGHLKDLWVRVVAMFDKSIADKQLAMAL